jgi:hypothetical protein
MAKYKKHFLTMLEENQALFNEFKGMSPDNDAFQDTGNKVIRVIRRYEDELCAKSEGGRYGKFSENLSEKFQGEVHAYFPTLANVRLE